MIVLGYIAYAAVRQVHGKDESPRRTTVPSITRATSVDVQRALGWPSEAAMQRPLLRYEDFLVLVGGFYGAAHFLVTAGVLIWLLARRPAIYRWWRNCLAAVTAVAVALFALYPTAPPRLLPEGDPERTVDTLETIGGLWSYNRGVLERISDPFAAMPSLHLGWATWAAIAVYAAGRPGVRRALACAAYPLATTVSVILTGTHWMLDAVAGIALVAAVAGAGAVMFGSPFRRALEHRDIDLEIATAPDDVTAMPYPTDVR
jgi:hypothetical protein